MLPYRTAYPKQMVKQSRWHQVPSLKKWKGSKSNNKHKLWNISKKYIFQQIVITQYQQCLARSAISAGTTIVIKYVEYNENKSIYFTTDQND